MGKRGVKLIAGLLFVILVFVIKAKAVSAGAAYDFEYKYKGQTLRYEIINPGSETKSGTVMVTGIKGQEYSFGDVIIPETVSDIGITYKVTQIKEEAFGGCMDLYSFQLPETIIRIGNSAFSGCGSLLTINIPASVTSMGDYAFSGCFSLTGINLPSGIKSIGADIFNGCTGLKNIIIPEGVTSVGMQAFYNCSNLTEIHLPETLESIGIYAFYGCEKLTVINIPDSLKEIGKDAFLNCSSLTEPVLPEGAVITSKGKVFTFKYAGSYFDYKILSDPNEKLPGTAEFLGTKGNTYVSGNVKIPGTVTLDGLNYNVTKIDASVFEDCDDLTGVEIPDEVTGIGDRAFYNCRSLKNLTIPESVTSIGNEAFYNCSSFTSIKLPKNVTSIGDSAFYNCRNLTVVNIPKGVTRIGAKTFYDCKLKNIEIPDGVKTIGESAFSGCTSLTGIKIPESVTSIGIYAFTACKSLNSIQFPKKLTSIEAGVLAGCSKLKSFVIPERVKSIGSSAFDSCTSLENIKIPYKVTSIGAYAFNNCTGLKKLYIPVSVKSIREYAFRGTKLEFSVSKSSYGAAYLKENGYPYTYLKDSSSKNIGLDDIVIKQKDIRKYPGEKVTLSVIYYPSNTTVSRKVTWTSSNKKVATIDANGRITAVGSGSATITAVVGSKKTTRIMYVELNPPKTVKAVSADYNSIKVTWSPVAGASSYRVYRSTSKDKDYFEIAQVPNTSITDINLGKGRTYYYKISAHGYTGKTALYSSYTKVASAKPIPAVPAKVKAVSASKNSNKLSWSPVNGAVGYSIYRSDSKNGTYKWISTVMSVSYTDPALKTGKTYYYKVRAYNYNYTGKAKVFGNFSPVVNAKPQS